MSEMSGYVILFPSYFLAGSFSGKPQTPVDLRDPDIWIVGSKQDKIIPVFTDKAGAEEFAETLELKHPVLGILESRERLIEFLTMATENGYEQVALDPRAKTAVRWWTIAELFRELERGRS